MRVTNILSDNPAVVIADPIYISHRIDPNPFKPEYIYSDEKLDEYETNNGNVFELEFVLKKGKDGLSGGATPLGANYKNCGVRFIRTSEINDCWIDGNSCVFISDEDDNSMQRSRLRENDVLLTITGACFGKSAIVSKNILPANISQHSVRIRLNNSVIPSFLVAYLNSQIGQQQIFKQTVGSTRQAIDYIGIKKIRVPAPDNFIQEYIGKKISLSEKCREEAICSFEKASRIFDDALDYSKLVDVLDLEGKASFVQPEFLNYKLFAGAYLPKYVQLDEHIQDLKISFNKLYKLCEPIEYGHMPTENYASKETGKPFIRVTNIEGNLIIDTTDLKYVPSDCDVKKTVQDGDILMVQCGNTTGKIGVVNKATDSFVYPSFSFRIRSKGKLNQFYLAFALNSNLVQMLLWRTVKYSTVRPNTTKPDVEELLIPVLEDNLMEQIGFLTKSYLDLKAKALYLISQAKSDVEALIEGKLDTDSILSGKLKAPTWEDIEKELEGI